MTRSRLALPSLPVFLVLAVVVAVGAFGLTRWLVADDATTLPPLAVEGDTAAAAPGALDAPKLYASRVDTVVAVDATIGGEPMNGSGVVVHTDGTIVTASHVVHDYKRQLDAASVFVRFRSGDELPARVVATDRFNDLAVLRIDPARMSRPLAAAPLADSDRQVVGAEVMAIGSPYGNDWTPTLGNISQLHRVIDSRINDQWQIPDALQFDAAINKGNSGGPLFNARGEIIGINQQIHTPNEANTGVSFAISSNIVRRALEQAARSAQVRYAWLGVDTIALTPQLAAEHGLSVTHGALVQSVDGPAARAQLSPGRAVTHAGRAVQLGDVVVELAGQPVRSRDDLLRIAGTLDPEQPTRIVYVRNGQRVPATITPGTAV